MIQKSVALLLVLITVFLAFPACKNTVTELHLEQAENCFAVGDELTLEATDQKGRPLENSQVFWSSSDPGVASVTKDGKVTVKEAGYCEITAKYAEDLAIFDRAVIFSPYETVETSESSVVDLPEDWSTTGVWDAAAGFAWKYGKLLVKSLTGTLSSVGIVLTVLSFLQKDKYMFSMAEPLRDVKNGVIYTLSDWGNEAVEFSWDNVTYEALGASMEEGLKPKDEYGASFDELIALMRATLMRDLANDSIYHLDCMDDDYEYRVVVRADYTTFTNIDFYSNGLLVGLGLSIKEIAQLDLEAINDNYTYHIRNNEVINVQNLRICVESRPKG